MSDYLAELIALVKLMRRAQKFRDEHNAFERQMFESIVDNRLAAYEAREEAAAAENNQ